MNIQENIINSSRNIVKAEIPKEKFFIPAKCLLRASEESFTTRNMGSGRKTKTASNWNKRGSSEITDIITIK